MKKLTASFAILAALALPPRLAGANILDSALVGWWTLDTNSISGTSVSDSSGGGRTATLFNSPVTGGAGMLGQSVAFVGAINNQINLPIDAALQPATTVTVSAWYRYTSSRVYDLLAGYTDGGSNGYRAWHNVGDAGAQANSLIFSVNAYATGEAAVAMTADGKWHHFVGTYDGTTAKAYLDGVKGNDGSVSTTITYTGATGIVGDRVAGGWTGWTGAIDDVRIYNRALTAADVAQLYYQGRISHFSF